MGNTVLLQSTAMSGGTIYDVANEAARDALTDVPTGARVIIASNQFGNKEVDFWTGSAWQITWEENVI